MLLRGVGYVTNHTIGWSDCDMIHTSGSVGESQRIRTRSLEVSPTVSRTCNGERPMSLSWFSDRSLKVSPKARLVDDGASEALRRRRESIDWQPANGFLKDQVQYAPEPAFARGRPERQRQPSPVSAS